MKMIITWKQSSYIWAFCTAGWIWIAIQIPTDATIGVALACMAVTLACALKAAD